MVCTFLLFSRMNQQEEHIRWGTHCASLTASSHLRSRTNFLYGNECEDIGLPGFSSPGSFVANLQELQIVINALNEGHKQRWGMLCLVKTPSLRGVLSFPYCRTTSGILLGHEHNSYAASIPRPCFAAMGMGMLGYQTLSHDNLCKEHGDEIDTYTITTGRLKT